MPAFRRAPLNIARAAARIRQDSWDDMWPDPASLIDLPTSKDRLHAARRRIAAFRRDPDSVPIARVCLVPKPNGLMRTAHVLTPDARMYLQALVDAIMYDVDPSLVPRPHVIGYRPTGAREAKAPFGTGIDQWKQHRRHIRDDALSGKWASMATTDIVAFFEQVSHRRLMRQLVAMGAKANVVEELKTLLKQLMGSSHGLPQGSEPSSFLANVYLSPLDHVLVPHDIGYYRYVDDITILARTSVESKRMLRLVEEEARQLGLQLQSEKTQVFDGEAAISAEVSKDDEIEGIDYVVRRTAFKRRSATIRRTWRSIVHRKHPYTRLVKYALARLAGSQDPIALSWSLASFGERDWLADRTARYLSKFADRRKVQDAIADHLVSDQNASEWEEAMLIRAMLSATSLRRPLLNRYRALLGDKNASIEARCWAAVGLGAHGNADDHEYVARFAAESEYLDRAILISLQESEKSLRGATFASIGRTYPPLKPLAELIKGLAIPKWPRFP